MLVREGVREGGAGIMLVVVLIEIGHTSPILQAFNTKKLQLSLPEPRISSMYLDTLLMPKISKFYTIRFSQKWFFYHLNIFKRYEFLQNLKVIAQKLRPPCPIQF